MKIAVVEDHDFFRNGLCMAIKRFKFASLAYEGVNGLDFIEKQKANPADIVLLDVMMPVMNGYEAFLQAQKLFPDLKYIILTMLEDDFNIEKFVKAGVHGYLLKNIEPDELERALKTVTGGRNYYSSELMSYFSRQFSDKPDKNGAPLSLTIREMQILRLICKGYSSQEIASELGISVRTVTNHRFSLKSKTKTRNVANLITYAIDNKLT